MATKRIVCPDCKTVLRPTKPVPDGKKVKCPECGNLFVTPGLQEEEARTRKQAAGKPQKAAIKKGGADSSSKPPVDDDEDVGIYKFSNENEDKPGEKPEIIYSDDTSIKDLRGPAQAAVMKPSNYIILVGGINCLCDIFIICYCFWPMVFSEYVVDYQEYLPRYYDEQIKNEPPAPPPSAGAKPALSKNQQRKQNLPKDRKELTKEELAALDEETDRVVFWRFIFLGIYVFMLIWDAVIIIGGVKIQNLEARSMGMISAIMMFFPFSVSGIVGLLQVMLYFADYIFGGPDFGFVVEIMQLFFYPLMGFVYIFAIFLGVWTIRTLTSKEVVDGYNYVAE